ncbi:MAG: hypothetical protein CMP26_04925 [Roseibacillus sp.]|nr:hypothetical protein [Roseibacillus sp.]HAO95348.1 hypothetical protein [Verrucomicrobiales bacterium]
MRALVVSLLLCSTLTGFSQFYNDYELEPHGYFSKDAKDPVTLLMKRVQRGEVLIKEPNGKPLVERLLRELGLNKDTQVLVFSRTSLQRREVSYSNPRALYFNESVYLGWMPNGRIEIASFDPELGPIFYFQRELDDASSPLLARTRSCLGCHAGDATNFLPGSLGRSVYPDKSGRSLRSIDDYRRSGHHIPLHDRYGGWFVSGNHGAMRHMGNAIASREGGKITIDREQFANLEKLDRFFSTEAYPAPGSDIAALLVFDHQVTMHHRLVEAAYRARQSLFDSKLDPKETDVSKLSKGRSTDEFLEGRDKVVDYLLFRDETPIPKVSCDPAFRRAFSANRIADRRKRSLKDLRLDGRIFENRCSYMIYSPTFDQFPPMLKGAIYARIHEILTSPKPVEGFDYLGKEEKRRILEILDETKEDLPPGWL